MDNAPNPANATTMGNVPNSTAPQMPKKQRTQKGKYANAATQISQNHRAGQNHATSKNLNANQNHAINQSKNAKQNLNANQKQDLNQNRDINQNQHASQNPNASQNPIRRSIAYLAFREAFPHTLPILVGYLLMGATFGILLQKAGFSWVWALGMGVVIYAGAMQFACVVLLANGVSLAESFLLSLMINSRQIFYALSALGLFKSVEKKKKFYLIFSLTDETFALLNLKKPRPQNPYIADLAQKDLVEYNGYFMFFIALLNQIYWVLGCVCGAILSQNLSDFNAQGMAFVMNAIFIVLFIEQWRNLKDKSPALIGIFVSLVCLLIFGKEIFLLPSLLGIWAGIWVATYGATFWAKKR